MEIACKENLYWNSGTVCTLYSNLCLYRYFYCCSFTFANSSVFRRLLPFDLCALLLSFLFTPFYFFLFLATTTKVTQQLQR